MYLLYPVPSSKVLLMWIYALTRIIPCSEHCLMYVSDMWRANQSSVCRTPQVILTILWGLLGDSSQIFNPSLPLCLFSITLFSLQHLLPPLPHNLLHFHPPISGSIYPKQMIGSPHTHTWPKKHFCSTLHHVNYKSPLRANKHILWWNTSKHIRPQSNLTLI